MDNKEYFLFYKSWIDIIAESIPDTNRQNQMLRAILEYGINGIKSFPEEKMFLEQVYAQIDYSKGKHEKAVENGRNGGKGGRGTSKARYGNQNASKRKQTQPNSNDNSNTNNNSNTNIITHPSDITHGFMSSDEINKFYEELGDEYE